MKFSFFISLLVLMFGFVGISSGETNQNISSAWITLGSSGVRFRKLSEAEMVTYEKTLRENHLRNGEIVEPYLRDFETRTQVLCEQLLELISACRIRDALEKEDEILAGNPCMNPPKDVNSHGFTEEVYRRCDRVKILILRYFHLALSRAKEIDLDEAAKILVKEKSFSDWPNWPNIRYPNDKEKQEAERMRIARYAALERLDGTLVYILESECGRIEDQLGLCLRNLKESKLLKEYNRFVAEIKRVIKDPELQGEVLRAEHLPLGYYFHRRKPEGKLFGPGRSQSSGRFQFLQCGQGHSVLQGT